MANIPGDGSQWIELVNVISAFVGAIFGWLGRHVWKR